MASSASSGESVHRVSVASSVASDIEHGHTQSSRRSCSRGIRFRGFVWDGVVGLAEELGVDVTRLVNLACERLLTVELTGEVKQRFLIEAELSHLMEEEKQLRERLTVILRSGAYLRDYAEKLLEGDRAQVSNLRSRRGVYSHVNQKELDVILRILARREEVSKCLVAVLDKLLPNTRYQLGVTEHGWKIRRVGGGP